MLTLVVEWKLIADTGQMELIVDMQKGSEKENIIRWLLTCTKEGNGGTVLGVLVLTTVSQTTLTLSKGLVSVLCSCEGKSW